MTNERDRIEKILPDMLNAIFYHQEDSEGFDRLTDFIFSERNAAQIEVLEEIKNTIDKDTICKNCRPYVEDSICAFRFLCQKLHELKSEVQNETK